MKLSQSTDYSLRLIVYLSKENKMFSNRELSSNLQIPYHLLTKLVQRLNTANILLTKKGKYGGVRLNKNVESITLKNIVEAIEGPIG